MKPLLLIAIVIATLTLTGDAFAETKKRLDLAEDASSEAADNYEQVLEQLAAAAPEQRKKLLGSLFVSGAPNRGVELIAAATADMKEGLLEAIVQLVHDVVRRPIPRSVEDNHILMNCAGLLQTASDDNTTLAAFDGNLKKLEVWAVEYYAIEALSSCDDSRAVELMADLARAQIRESNEWLAWLSPSASEEERAAAVDKAASLFSAIRGLAISANSSGKAVASRLRDEFIALFDGNPYRKTVIREIEADLDPLMRTDPQTVSPDGRIPLWFVWVALAGVLCVFGLGLWFRRRSIIRPANCDSLGPLDSQLKTDRQPQIVND